MWPARHRVVDGLGLIRIQDAEVGPLYRGLALLVPAAIHLRTTSAGLRDLLLADLQECIRLQECSFLELFR